MVKFIRPSLSACLLTALATGHAAAQDIKLVPPAPPLAQPNWLPPERPRILEDGPVTVCFAEGTDPRYAYAITELTNAYNILHFGAPDYFTNGSWSTQGTPRLLTWSFVPDGVAAPGLSGQASAASTLFASMDAAFAAQGGRATWTNRFVQCFARWDQLTGLSYTRVTVGGNDWDDGQPWGSPGLAGARGDVRIAMRTLDGQSNVLAFNQFPGGGSDMVLDSGDANGNFNSSSNQNRFLRNVVMHEHGHGIGLLHVCTQNTVILMEPFIDTSYDGPRQDDIRGGQFNYGDPFESNNTAATATALGALASGGTINSQPVPAPLTGSSDPNSSIYSIDNSGKQDWFSFTVSEAIQGTITVTPVGSTYDNSTQGGSGCPATTNNINALAAGDLAIEVYASNGTTLVASGNTSAAGIVETLSGVNLGTPGTYYLKIFANSSAGTQLYRFSIAATSPCPSFTLQPVSSDYCEGALVALMVNATGAPAPTLQWRKNGNSIPGATGTTYAFNQATSANSGTYDCVATNSCSSVTSNPAVIRITTSPEITTPPASQTVAIGSPVTFSVISPTTDPLTFQWLHDGQLINGATASSYTIPSVAQEDEGAYRCVLSNLCGTLFSPNAQLTIGTANPCYANCDGSTAAPILNVNDFTCFLNKYAAGDPYANCDGSTAAPVLNVNDFTCFLNTYAVGCP